MKPIDTRVESVTLYHRGATVRRTASLDFSSGVPAEVFLAGLPLSLVDHTVRVRLEAEGGGEVLLSNVRVGLFAPPRGTPPVAPEQKALQAVHDSLWLLRDRISQLDAETQRLVDVGVLPRPTPEEGKMPPPAPMVARVALETLFEESVSKRIELARQLRDEVKALEEKERELQRALQLASTAQQVRPDELSKSIHASVVSGASPKKVRLVLEYFVVGARWAPSYQCRMTRDCLQADLQLRALVCQRTGEDWRGVMLQLSTASPMSWTEVPELGAIKIGKAQPPPPSQRGFRPPPKGAASLFLDYDRGLSSARAAMPVIPSWQASALSPHGLPTARPASSRSESVMDAMSAAEPQMDLADDEAPMEEERELKKEVAAPARRAMAPPPAPPMSAAPMGPGAGVSMLKMKSAKAGRARDSGADSDEFGGESPLAAMEVVLYASLRLGGAETGTRGSLTPVDRRQAFRESLAKLNLVATFDVLALVERAESQGQEIYSVRAPDGSSDVRAEAGWYDYVYGTDAAVDVPSDGTFHSVPVNTRTATSDVLYVVVPREDPQVYRQALVRNPLPSPLLPGPVEVSVGGEYVLTTTLPSVAPGGDFKLSLGVEQGIKVARNARYLEQRSGDKVVATNELIHDLDIEVVNNLERAAKCEVRERVPQPAPEAEVVVEEGGIKPTWEPYKQEERGRIIEGGRRWVFTVKPGATQKLAAQYRVKLYANNELVGGNRREA
ncbi:MAG: DUF4139 domain-containing protein [Archangium sp.]|nr:DUF4139 domain-containing protein [Archangium sp.]